MKLPTSARWGSSARAALAHKSIATQHAVSAVQLLIAAHSRVGAMGLSIARKRRLGTGTGFACAKLSEVLPRSERSLATVRMTDFWMPRFGTGTGFACAKLSEVLPRGERSLATVSMTDLFGCGDLEPVPASLREAVRGPSAKRACARSGRDDGEECVAASAGNLTPSHIGRGTIALCSRRRRRPRGRNPGSLPSADSGRDDTITRRGVGVGDFLSP